MSCDIPDFVVGSRDKLRLLFVDVVKNASTGKVTNTPIDLTSVTGLVARCKITDDTGAVLKASFNISLTADADQVTNKGYAQATLALTDFDVAGNLEVRGKYVDAATMPHESAVSLSYLIGAAL